MKPKYNETIRKVLLEIKSLTSDLPQGKRNQISNRCDKISFILRKITKYENTRPSNTKTNCRQIHC